MDLRSFCIQFSLPFKTGKTTHWYGNRGVRELHGPTGRSVAGARSQTLLEQQLSPAKMQLHMMKYLFRGNTQQRLQAAEDQPGTAPQA